MLCGNKQYDPRTHVCCDEELIVITSQNAKTCCGINGLYDETYAVCCSGNIIYISGLGGVRIEDDIILTEEGCIVLNEFPKKLIRL